jgi:hypothetical protein
VDTVTVVNVAERVRRVGAPLSLAVLVVPALVLGAAAGSARADTVSYSQASTVTAVAVESVNEQYPLLITGIDKPLSAYAAYVTGDLDSTGVSDAQAAIFTPGSGLEQGVGEFQGLICSSGIPDCPTAPITNPLEAYASYPAEPAVKATGQGPAYATDGVSLASGSAAASAGPDGNTATAATGGGTILAGSTAALSLGAVSSTLTQQISATGLVVTATSTVSHVALAGVLAIDSVTATASQTLRDGSVVARAANVRLSGVTVLGQPAAIDGSGVHVLSAGDSGMTLGALNTVLSTALSAAHLTVTAGGVDHSAAGTGGRTAASGLTINYDQTVPAALNPVTGVLGGTGLPNLPSEFSGTVVLGSAGAVTGSVSVPNAVVTLPAAPVGPVTGTAGTASVPARTVFVPGTAAAAPSGTGQLPAPSAAVVDRSFGTTLSNWSLRVPYLVLVALAVLVLVGVTRAARRRTGAEEDM